MAPSPAKCPEREKLTELLRNANRELNAIHEAETSAVIAGNIGEFDELQARLAMTCEHRALVVDRLKVHLSEHGC